MTNDLLPCPFDHKHELERYITGDGTMVSCCSCGIEMHVDQWNTRANKNAEVDLDDLRGDVYVEVSRYCVGTISPVDAGLGAKIAFDYLAASGHLATGKGGGDETDYSEYYRPERLEYTMCGKIYARHKDGTRHMFMDVRGWGHLTGGGAKALPHEVATGIQDAWAREVVDLWNNKTTDQQKTAAPTQSDAGELEAAFPDTCDGKEQDAFEAWAASEKMDMSLHPLHYLFLNPKTAAARDGWRAGIKYCRAHLEKLKGGV